MEVIASNENQRESKQFWPMLHHPGPLPLPIGSPVLHAVSPPRLVRPLSYQQGYNLPPLESPAEPLKIDESGEENEQVVESKTLSKVADRVGSTVVNPNFEFAENATPEEEKAIVESVNQLIGAVGRQAINGIDIFSEDEVIQPGRPNTAPIENSPQSFQRPPLDIVQRQEECCLFVMFDGSAFYFDEYLRLLTGPYRLMYGTVNGHPHYVARGCKEPDQYGPNCSYIWNSGYGWIIGIGTYIGQTKGVVYTRSNSACPTNSNARWRYLNKDLEWKDNGNIYVNCAS